MMEEILEKMYLGNRILDYVFCVTTFIVSALVVTFIKRFALHRLQAWAEKTKTKVDDFFLSLIQKIILPLLYFGAFYFSVKLLKLNQKLADIINVLGLALLTICVTRLMTVILGYVFKLYWLRRGRDESLERSLNGILKVIKVVVWGIAIIFFLDNLGFKISTVIAGLGIGGIAVGLAAQAILKDLFSYFSIVFDRPFEIGDFIIIGDYLGSVEYIGIKTTRIRSLGGEQLIFSNSDLTDSRVRNYKRMERRRVLFRLGVVYQTSPAVLKEIPGIIEKTIKKVNDTVFDRAHFFSYGDFSLIYEIVYYVIGPDYNKYMDIQQEINLAIKEEFQKRNIEFAYPSQTLFLSKVEADSK
jgi:small-conductance mechanosensitive channel